MFLLGLSSCCHGADQIATIHGAHILEHVPPAHIAVNQYEQEVSAMSLSLSFVSQSSKMQGPRIQYTVQYTACSVLTESSEMLPSCNSWLSSKD